ncbi:MAG: hypothetical protein NTV24_03410 [Candidatus Woesebacteria bacterium]|nr:hypothetical protein [Candidatus Woesebacteria bacterium]
MLNKFKLIVFLLTVSFLLAFPLTSIAQSPEASGLTIQNTLPGNAKYPFKRLKEKIIYLLSFSQKAKFSYGKLLLEKRLSELASLVDSKNPAEITVAGQRFAYQAGILAENSVKGQKTVIDPIFSQYKTILGKLRDRFPANSAYWLSLQQDIDTLNILGAKLK